MATLVPCQFTTNSNSSKIVFILYESLVYQVSFKGIKSNFDHGRTPQRTAKAEEGDEIPALLSTHMATLVPCQFTTNSNSRIIEFILYESLVYQVSFKGIKSNFDHGRTPQRTTKVEGGDEILALLGIVNDA
jgi:hypothetical protein